MNSRIKSIIDAVFEKKGFDVKVLDISQISSFTDYFIIVSAASTIQSKAIFNNIIKKRKRIEKPFGIEGEINGEWILIDYGDIIVHIFTVDTREKYNLELLWADAKILTVEDNE